VYSGGVLSVFGVALAEKKRKEENKRRNTTPFSFMNDFITFSFFFYYLFSLSLSLGVWCKETQINKAPQFIDSSYSIDGVYAMLL
jgi:hypothetical protein